VARAIVGANASGAGSAFIAREALALASAAIANTTTRALSILVVVA